MNYKSFFKDVGLNTFSNFILLGFIQLIVFPSLSRSLSEGHFGKIAAVYGINSIFLSLFGDSLNNLRIVYQNKNGKNFNFIACFICIVSLVCTVVIFLFYTDNTDITNVLFFSLATSLGILRLYLGATYRISIKYKPLLFDNLFVLGGLIIGFGVYLFTSMWSIIFLLGEIFGVYYFFKLSNIREQGFTRDENFVAITKDYGHLCSSYGIGAVGNYLDRIMIIPMLGSISMGIYYAASSISKIIILLLGQINSVLLSYLMKNKKGISKRLVFTGQLFLMVSLGVLYFPLNWFTKIMVQILYPSIYEQAAVLIPLITVGVLFFSTANLLKVFVLKYYPINFQLRVQLLYTAIYIPLAFFFSKYQGIIGFTRAYAVSGILLYLIFLVIFICFDFKEDIK